MSRKKRQNGAQQPVRTADGYNNFTAKLGSDTRNIQTGGMYMLMRRAINAAHPRDK